MSELTDALRHIASPKFFNISTENKKVASDAAEHIEQLEALLRELTEAADDFLSGAVVEEFTGEMPFDTLEKTITRANELLTSR